MLKRTQVSSYSAPLAGLVIISLVLWHANSPSIGHRSQSAEIAPAISLDAETRIIAFCGDCHAMPRPESFPRDRWHKSVRKGYEHYARSGRSDLKPPPIHVAVDYFRSHAPSRLQFPVAKKGPQVAAARFTVQKVDWPRNHRVWPAISHLKWAKLHPDREPVLLVCDMRDGTVAALDIRRSGVNRQVLARLEVIND